MTTPEPKTCPRGQKNSSAKKLFKNQSWRFLTNDFFWFSSIFCQMKFFEPRDPFLVLELSFLKGLSWLAFKDLYKISKHVGRSLFILKKINKSKLQRIGLIAAFLAFMALKVKLLQSAEFLCQNGPSKPRKL